ncbi:MAG: hypothetical protein ABH805_01900, partial [Candidatus Nealsonbacteria bacterium]
MRAFELYFEQKNKDEVFLQSFVCEPENIYQQKLGHLYMVGELNQALPPNAHFLSNLALAIKQAYYSQSLKKSPETSLREALKKGNEFLEKESKKGNVEWLGNLNFAVLSFKDHILNFAKTGTFKIFLLRTEENIDLSQSLEVELKSPDPLRVFSSMAGGKLSSDDKVVVVNKKVISLFKKKNNFIDQLSHASTSKELKQVIKKNQEVLSEASGVCLFLTQNYEVKEEQT